MILNFCYMHTYCVAFLKQNAHRFWAVTASMYFIFEKSRILFLCRCCLSLTEVIRVSLGPYSI
jgi:hypothetical protein